MYMYIAWASFRNVKIAMDAFELPRVKVSENQTGLNEIEKSDIKPIQVTDIHVKRFCFIMMK